MWPGTAWICRRTLTVLVLARPKWYRFYIRCGSSSNAAKSAANKLKHRIDFVEAQARWADRDRLETPARTVDEPRYQVIGRIGETTWSAFITYPHEAIHIISVRRARAEEKTRYVAD